MKIQCLGEGYVEYIDHMGDDLRIVNAARVSMNKHHTKIDDTDEGLIRYLVLHKHTSPFRHCHITFRIKMPIFVARQFTKHRIGVEINEISGRYVKFKPEFYKPLAFRKSSKEIKQGSKNEIVSLNAPLIKMYFNNCLESYRIYNILLERGVCKEQARMILPVSTYTEFYCTMSLQAIQHFYVLRSKSDAQKEIRDYAFAFDIICGLLFPISWKELIK